MDKIATRIAGKREGRAEKLGIPKPREVLNCPIKNCALWPYRMGRYPKGVGG